MSDGLDEMDAAEAPPALPAYDAMPPYVDPRLVRDREELDALRSVWRRLTAEDVEWARGVAATLAGDRVLDVPDRAKLSVLLIRFGR